jgi:putative transposase
VVPAPRIEAKMEQEPVRARIRRLYVPNALYFIVATVQGRRPIFADESNVELLRETLHRVKEIYPFAMRAYVFLPEHLHLLIQIHESTTISEVLHSIQRNLTLNYKRAHGITRKANLWQRGFWDHVIRDEQDLGHFHYIHYNPVKHGYVKRPENYGHSSFNEYVKRGWYEIGWGHVEPPELKGLEFE